MIRQNRLVEEDQRDKQNIYRNFSNITSQFTEAQLLYKYKYLCLNYAVLDLVLVPNSFLKFRNVFTAQMFSKPPLHNITLEGNFRIRQSFLNQG